MSLYKQFGTDKKAENEGVFVEIATGDNESCKFKLARMGSSNKAYTKLLEKKMRPYKKLLDMDKMPPQTSEKILIEVFVGSVLLGWENVKDRDGNELVFNEENAIALLKDLPDLYEYLLDCAKSATTFKDAIREEDAKN